jgi:hypothetical protein
MNFKKWFEQATLGTEMVDESKIDSLYNKARVSVQIVQMYDQTRSADPKSPPDKRKLLLNINTIAPLASGVYGMYMSSENKKIIGPEVLNRMKLIFPKDAMLAQKLQTLPTSIIKKYAPDIDEKKIQPSDTIHVNVQRIIKEFGDSPKAVIEIASTIVHEATHELEREFYGRTDETGPVKAERDFLAWVKQNWSLLSRKFSLGTEHI